MLKITTNAQLWVCHRKLLCFLISIILYILIEQLCSFASFLLLVLDNETEDNSNESSDGGDLDHPGYYGDHHNWDSTSDVEKEKLSAKGITLEMDFFSFSIIIPGSRY